VLDWQIGWRLVVSVKEKKLTDFSEVLSHGRRKIEFALVSIWALAGFTVKSKQKKKVDQFGLVLHVRDTLMAGSVQSFYSSWTSWHWDRLGCYF
jgi:hypothetical protein